MAYSIALGRYVVRWLLPGGEGDGGGGVCGTYCTGGRRGYHSMSDAAPRAFTLSAIQVAVVEPLERRIRPPHGAAEGGLTPRR